MRRAGRPPNIPVPAGKYRRLDGLGVRTLDAQGREVVEEHPAAGSDTAATSAAAAARPNSDPFAASTSNGPSSASVDGSSAAPTVVPVPESESTGNDEPAAGTAGALEPPASDGDAAARKKRAYSIYDKARYIHSTFIVEFPTVTDTCTLQVCSPCMAEFASSYDYI